jgi:hypothetical protein
MENAVNTKEKSSMKKSSGKNSKTPSVLGLIVCLGALPLLYGVTGCSSSKHAIGSSPRIQEEGYTSVVGPAGPEGPAGPQGAKGIVGATGAPGGGIAGATGEQGPSGPSGIRGDVGATGRAGEVAVGQPGETGPAGPAGAQGASGDTGEQGASLAGSGGTVGPAGPAGPQGPTGNTGVQGPTLVGPTGPAGRAGRAGVQGETGDTGARGSTTTGVVGATGPAGESGPQGEIGSQGAQGPAGVVARWTWYRDFRFDSNQSNIRASDAGKLSEIARYLKANPSLNAGIDGSMAPRNQELSDQRVRTVRDALVEAGVPTSKIQTVTFAERDLPHDGRVAVLLRTANY